MFKFLNGFAPLVIGFETTMTLYRSLLNGTLAIAGIAAALGFATEAQAATFTVAQVNTPGFTFSVLDKVFSNFNIPTTATGLQAGDEVIIDVVGGEFSVEFDPSVAGQTFITGSGSLEYTVTIPFPYINVFNTAENVTSVSGTGTSSSRTLAATGGLNPLVSPNSTGAGPGSFSPGVQSITVTDSWNTGNRRINSFVDRFVQDPIDPDPTIPEPSAVLGLLALGLCGTLVGRKKG